MIQLLNYQREGVELLLQRSKTLKCQLLADDMGLGKTAQAIYFRDKANLKKTLILCPASLRENWNRELTKFSEHPVEPKIIYGAKDIDNEDHTITICSYDLATKLNPYFYDLLILDEAHYVKSWKAIRTRHVIKKLIPASKHVLFLTGTPIPNQAIDLHPIISQCLPQSNYSSYRTFANTFTYPKQTPWGIKYSGSRNTELLNQLLKPIMLRRLKSDVLKELPDKIYQTIPIVPKSKEAAILARQSLELSDVAVAQIANNQPPTEAVASIRRLLGLAKIPDAISLILDLLADKPKLLVFAYHLDVIQLLQAELRAKGISSYEITGAINPSGRQAIVDAFQNPAVSSMVIIGQIQASGTGLTLHATDTCIFIERDWTPANNLQAEDRLHRIGQSNTVQVLDFVVAGSLDEAINNSLATKTRAIKNILK